MLKKRILPVLAAGLLITSALGQFLAGEPTSASADPSGKQQVVEVRLTEYKIEMPLKLSAGRTLFKVTNTGEMFHSFEIEGKGIETEVESGVEAGRTKALELTLVPGSYEVYCPVHGHKKAGMSVMVQVS